MRDARESDWSIEPLPALHEVVELGQVYSDKDIEAIRKGFVPEEMEEKWFIYWKDERLHFHRSWTGFCIFILEFERRSQGYVATRFLVNRDPQQYKADDAEKDRETVLSLIEGFLLR